MKEKIIEALTTKFNAYGGIKAEVLDRIATKAAKTITSEDDVTTFVEGVTFQTIIDAEGDRRATDAQKTAVANYERKYNIKEGKSIEKPKTDEQQPQAAPEDMPAWAKALYDSNKVLVESNKAMADRLAAFDGERTANSRRSQLDEVLKTAPEKIRTRYEKDFERFNFKDDEDFATWLGETKTDVEGITSEFASRGGIVTPPKVGGAKPNGGVSANVQARIDAKSQQTTSTAIQG